MLGFNFFYVAFPVFAVGNLRWSVTDTGVFFAVLSLLMALVQGPVLSRLARKVADCTLVLGRKPHPGGGFRLLRLTQWRHNLHRRGVHGAGQRSDVAIGRLTVVEGSR